MRETEVIELNSISKTYQLNGKSFKALRSVDLHVKKGEIFGVIGRSGAGKSTLVRCVNLLERPSGGSVAVAGSELTSLSESKLRVARRRIGMIFQHFNLLSTKTAFENIALPLKFEGLDKAVIEDRVKKLLKRVGLTKHQNHYPHELSGGQKQRVAIARSLATQPDVLLCDEATSALDPESTTSILELLKELNREMKLTILLITHEMSVIKSVCDRIGVMDDGEMVEVGEVVQVFANPQHIVTKTLTQQALHLELPPQLKAKIFETKERGMYPIVQMTFVGGEASEPVTAALFEKFGIKVNILQADLEYVKDTAVGFMICQFIGKVVDLKKSRAFLSELGIKTEVLGYART